MGRKKARGNGEEKGKKEVMKVVKEKQKDEKRRN